MAKYNVPVFTYANAVVTVETDETDPEVIAELALEQVGVSLCHQCADSRNDSLEIGSEWEPIRSKKDSAPEVYRVDD